MRAPPQILIKGDMSTEKSGPRLRPHFTPEPRRWIRPFGAPIPYCSRWRDGTSHVIFEPLELVEQLAALVPPPQFNLVRYHGVLAAGSAWRPLIVPDSGPDSADSSGLAHSNCPERKQPSEKSGCRPRNYSWAELMRRVWELDVLECPRCKGRMRILCAIHPPEAIPKILEWLGLPTRPPPLAPAVPGEDSLYYS